MGIESNGMVLAASQEDALSLLSLDKDLPPGAKVS
jgi:tRNA-binding EMAP/Myf-like protein